MSKVLHWRRKADQYPPQTTVILYLILVCATVWYGWAISDQYTRQMELSIIGMLLTEKIDLQLVFMFLGICGGCVVGLLMISAFEFLRRYMILRKAIQSMTKDLDAQLHSH